MALSPLITEIFNVDICRDLEIWVNSQSRSLEPTRIDLPCMTSCTRSIATMSLSRTVSEINGNFSRWRGCFGIGYRCKGSKN